MPHESISYIWQVTGCQHTLQPTEDDFEPPSIPALTPRGFSRWESLEILLGPEEHVPFLQYAVRNWHLKHPETGQEFPPDLAKNAFPAEPDPDVDRWHTSCADKLREEASQREREATRDAGVEPKFAYSHVRNPFPGSRQRPSEPAYAERPAERPLYNHVPGRYASTRPTRRPSPEKAARPERPGPERYSSSSRFDEHARRRSFSDYKQAHDTEPPPASYTHGPGAPYLDPNAKRSPPPRRHSQPRHYSSESSEDDEPTPPRTRRKPDSSPPSPTTRRYSPPQPSPAANSPQSFRPHRADARSEDGRRRPAPNPSLREKLTEKVSNILPNGITSDRPRNSARPSSYNIGSTRARRSRDRIPPSRLSRSYSDLSAESSDEEPQDEDTQRARRAREERDRDRGREQRHRERERGRQRDLDREREDERRDRYMRRPDMERRTSSHADAERRGGYGGYESRGREDRKRWDKRMPPLDDRGMSPAGRRHPVEPAYP